MTPIPNHLTAAFADVDQTAIATWWAGLSEGHREEVARLCDTRADTCFFGVVADESQLPHIEHGLTDDEEIKPVEQWELCQFEYLLNHPELVLIWDEGVRTFHVGCTAHAHARACWKSGHVASNFACPFANENCLMRPLLGRRVTWRSKTTLVSAAAVQNGRTDSTIADS
jgi:hypothetical protein